MTGWLALDRMEKTLTHLVSAAANGKAQSDEHPPNQDSVRSLLAKARPGAGLSLGERGPAGRPGQAASGSTAALRGPVASSSFEQAVDNDSCGRRSQELS
ncbi:hypothetical protein PGT21_022514 [Puccinia graminis f. sp. tritici]|uniref:Uncharacterized protein n=1 Tax=Puccinia graminis f. sp. tritici TaxID=56615 RepID=A0A5B0MFP4_PUCGR|nr:hypothetical protein PGT21_022514 [Puccinia graminis f. sp. tritici]